MNYSNKISNKWNYSTKTKRCFIRIKIRLNNILLEQRFIRTIPYRNKNSFEQRLLSIIIHSKQMWKYWTILEIRTMCLCFFARFQGNPFFPHPLVILSLEITPGTQDSRKRRQTWLSSALSTILITIDRGIMNCFQAWGNKYRSYVRDDDATYALHPWFSCVFRVMHAWGPIHVTMQLSIVGKRFAYYRRSDSRAIHLSTCAHVTVITGVPMQPLMLDDQVDCYRWKGVV